MGLNSIVKFEHSSQNPLLTDTSLFPEEAKEVDIQTSSLWMNRLIHNGNLDKESVERQIGQRAYGMLNQVEYRVCLMDLKHNNRSQETFHSSTIPLLTLEIRAVFEQNGYHAYITMQKHQLIILAFNFNPPKTTKEKITQKKKYEQIAATIHQIMNREVYANYCFKLGVGCNYIGFEQIHLSYEEAQKALSFSPYYQSTMIFYEDLGAFQILLNIHEQSMLESYVYKQLGPLIEEDKKKNSDLLKTLKTYLESNGSKKVASEELHIVRQSLYYRLEKIKDFLGEDYLDPQRRLALLLAIQAYELLKLRGNH